VSLLSILFGGFTIGGTCLEAKCTGPCLKWATMALFISVLSSAESRKLPSTEARCVRGML